MRDNNCREIKLGVLRKRSGSCRATPAVPATPGKRKGELIKSCCFTQKQVLEGNCQLAREEEAALGARRKQGQVSRGAEASPGL